MTTKARRITRATLCSCLVLAWTLPAVTSPAQLEETVLSLAHEGAAVPGGYARNARRDPFTPPGVPEKGVRAPGIAGMSIGELDLQGIVITPDGSERYALVLAPDGKGYSLRVGDTLGDGDVSSIEKTRVTYRRKVENPLVLHPYVTVVQDLDPEAR